MDGCQLIVRKATRKVAEEFSDREVLSASIVLLLYILKATCPTAKTLKPENEFQLKR